MKVRDSGMPEVNYWESLFNVPLILDRMRVVPGITALVEIGCGYGTFTIPAAARIDGILRTFDIDSAMVEVTAARARDLRIANIQTLLRDVIANGSGLEAESADYVMLFNILHHENPAEILQEAARILTSGGRVGCMHWNYDPNTPRGPQMDIRPTPEQIRTWLEAAGFTIDGTLIDLPPFHYGWIGVKGH